MGRREYPLSGYVVSLDDVKKVLSGAEIVDLDLLLEDGCENELEEFLHEAFPGTLPEFTFYRPSNRDTVDEPMHQGGWYLVFDESELFTKKKTLAHEMMLMQGIKPQFATWSVWG